MIVKNNYLFNYYCKYFFQEAISKWEIKTPEAWDRNYFIYSLYSGHVGVMETDKFGIICQQGTPWGYNVYYQPTKYNIVNPLFKKAYLLEIGKECAVIKLQPTWTGIQDIVEHYAELACLTYVAISMNLINSRLAYLIACGSKQTADAIKVILDKIYSGEVSAVYDKDYSEGQDGAAWTTFNNDIGGNYITDKLLEAERTIKNMFLTEIGINNSNFEKSERLLTGEIEANNEETKTKIQLWYDTVRVGVDMAHKLYGLSDFDITWRKEENKINAGGNESMGNERV